MANNGLMTVGDLEKLLKELKAEYGKGYKKLIVAIGDDEELNGMHHALFAQLVSPELRTDDEILVEMADECLVEKYENFFLIS